MPFPIYNMYEGDGNNHFRCSLVDMINEPLFTLCITMNNIIFIYIFI